ncbi:ribosome recycling factor [Platysternon megacephalum]|uniref:Ribosome recycling factor n=1 Tax=Platysternon megacephalum TaxID=55544 RepID=A0A4D9DCM6_9SAUR|nr:ribosome recycling factor [Platysternon megacephalum]
MQLFEAMWQDSLLLSSPPQGVGGSYRLFTSQSNYGNTAGACSLQSSSMPQGVGAALHTQSPCLRWIGEGRFCCFLCWRLQCMVEHASAEPAAGTLRGPERG